MNAAAKAPQPQVTELAATALLMELLGSTCSVLTAQIFLSLETRWKHLPDLVSVLAKKRIED
jgi:hypothetical protein